MTWWLIVLCINVYIGIGLGIYVMGHKGFAGGWLVIFVILFWPAFAVAILIVAAFELLKAKP